MTTSDIANRYRPTKLNEVVGQSGAVESLKAMAKSEQGLPHFLMFTGPSGCGKTTLARIIKTKLGCSDDDFTEINAASERVPRSMVRKLFCCNAAARANVDTVNSIPIA